MNKQEFAMWASAVKTYYPRENLLPNDAAMRLWFQELQDIEFTVASLALRKWVAVSKWSPTIADIREYARSVQQGEIPDWGEGWKEVQLAVRKYGRYDIQGAMQSFSPLTFEVVKRIGFEEICNSDSPEVNRANFRMIFEQLAQRKQKEEQLPPALAVAIKNKLLELQDNEYVGYKIEERKEGNGNE